MENNKNMEYLQNDEIDLRELWSTILKGKKIIISISILVVFIAFISVLKMPNIYKSDAILIPTESKSGGLGGLGGLAAMAGVSLGGGSMTPDVAFSSLLKNYDFMKKFVVKNKIVEYYQNENLDKNYVFAMGFRGVYDLFKSDSKKGKANLDALVFATIKGIQGKFSISSDKKTGLITVSYSDMNRDYPPVIINQFLKDASSYLVNNNLRIIDNKLNYFKKELTKADSFELRQSISGLVSKIVSEKVMMKSKKYYQCDILTSPSKSYIKAKVKPKRALILVVSFITSIILGIFLVFFLEFIKNSKENEK